MNTISQSEILLQDANNEVGNFLRKFQVADILKQCNGYKQKGFSVIQLFAYLVTLMFQPLSTYMSMRVGAYKEPFSKNTIRRFCNNTSINWHKFLRILSQKIVAEFMRPATSEKREEYFIIDDTPSILHTLLMASPTSFRSSPNITFLRYLLLRYFGINMIWYVQL